jgi:hypothetical protein
MKDQPQTSGSWIARKLALAGGMGSLTLAGGWDAHAGIVPAQGLTVRPPPDVGSMFYGPSWDVDGDSRGEFYATHLLYFTYSDFTTEFGSVVKTPVFLDQAYLGGARPSGPFGGVSSTMGFGRLVRSGRGLKKLAAGQIVDANADFLDSTSRTSVAVTTESQTGRFMKAEGWSMGQGGFFGFAFEIAGQRHFGWGELVLDPPSSGTRGYGFNVTQAYYNDTPGTPIKAGDTVGDSVPVPEPSSLALVVLAAGGVAAYRRRRQHPGA